MQIRARGPSRVPATFLHCYLKWSSSQGSKICLSNSFQEINEILTQNGFKKKRSQEHIHMTCCLKYLCYGFRILQTELNIVLSYPHKRAVSGKRTENQEMTLSSP